MLQVSECFIFYKYVYMPLLTILSYLFLQQQKLNVLGMDNEAASFEI